MRYVQQSAIIIRIHAARNLVYEAAFKADQGRMDRKLTAMAKWFAGETCVHVADEALRIYGLYGYTSSSGVERFVRDAKIIEITKEPKKSKS